MLNFIDIFIFCFFYIENNDFGNFRSDNESETFLMYWGVEQNCRKYTKYMAIFVLMDHALTAASLFASFYSIAIGNLDASTWIVTFNLVVPFDTTNLYGWYLLWILNFHCNFVYASCLASTSAYFVSFCLYIGGIVNHFNLLIDAVQTNSKLNQSEKNPHKFQKRYQQIKIYMYMAVDIQVKIFE